MRGIGPISTPWTPDQIARISVSEGHRIAEMTRRRVLESHSSVSDVLVHVDVEDDVDHDADAHGMPDRDELLQQLRPLLAGLPDPERVILHYFRGRVEAEFYLPQHALGDSAAVRKAEESLARYLAAKPLLGSLSISYGRQIFPTGTH